jgi:CRP-like cAMP-binding protein
MMSMLRDIKFENYFSFHSVLYNEGDPISHVYFIKEGEVEL